MKCIGVVGVGTVGTGVVRACCLAGVRVRIKDISEAAGKAALASISQDLMRQVAKGHSSEAEREAALARLTLTSSYEEFADCDLIVEAATARLVHSDAALPVLLREAHVRELRRT